MSTTLPLASSNAGAAAVVERLAARQQRLTAEREERLAQQQEEADTRENVSSFLGSYRSDYQQLQQRCSNAAAQVAAAQQDVAARTALLEQLETLSVDVSNKEENVSAASYFLPPYELRSCTSQLQQLRLQLADVKQQLQPKRKFAFSKPVAKTNISAAAAAAAAAAPSMGAQQQSQQQPVAAAPAATAPSTVPCAVGTPGQTAGTNPAAAGAATTNVPAPPAGTAHISCSTSGASNSSSSSAPPAPSMQDAQLIAAGHGFAGLHGHVLVASAQQLAGQGFVLHDLSDCQVFLLGRLSALRLQHLRGCTVYTGPVVGATFVDTCSSCTLMLASYQVRIHTATACQFYLRVRSRPIIEHSSQLTFAPYAAETLLCQQLSADAAAANGACDKGASEEVQQTSSEHQQQGQQQQQGRQQQQGQQQQHGQQQLHGQQQQHRQQQQQQQPLCQPQEGQQQHSLPSCPADWQPAQLLAAAQLSPDNGLWQQVDDFGWVKASASPHWRVLPEAERQQPPATLPS